MRLQSLLRKKWTLIAATAARAESRPRAVCLEWLDPYYVGGHWIPEMVSNAGGEDVLGRLREPSFRVSGEQIIEARARCDCSDALRVQPCAGGERASHRGAAARLGNVTGYSRGRAIRGRC